MRKSIKRILIAAGLLIVLGAGLSAAGWFLGGEAGFYLSGSGLHTSRELKEKFKLETLDKTALGDIRSLDLRSESTDIAVLPSDDGSFYLEYEIPPQDKQPVYSVKDGLLTMDVRGWRHDGGTGIAGFFMMDGGGAPMTGLITVYVPDVTLAGASIHTESANADLTGVSAGDMAVKTGSGNITAKETDTESGDFESESGNMKLGLKGMEEDYNFSLRTDSGEISMNSRTNEEEEELYEDHGAARSIGVTTVSGNIEVNTRH